MLHHHCHRVSQTAAETLTTKKPPTKMKMTTTTTTPKKHAELHNPQDNPEASNASEREKITTRKAPPHQQVDTERERGQHDDGADGTPSESQKTSFFLGSICGRAQDHVTRGPAAEKKIRRGDPPRPNPNQRTSLGEWGRLP